MHLDLRAITAALALVLAIAVAAPAGATPHDGCAPERAGEQCGAGNDRQTAGGGEKVPHGGWPKISGILWKVLDATDHQKVGTADNDELLGHHGDERLAGGPGDDVLWGDWDPRNNNEQQRDVLRGQAGDDFLYPSHGPSVVDGGPGDDHVWAYYGRGSIDCGAGAHDVARTRENGAFRVRNCERIEHFCSFGSNPDGSCRQPGSRRLTLVSRLRGLLGY